MMKTQLISLLLTCGLGLTSHAFAESASSQSSAKAAPPLEYGAPVSLETAKKIALAAEAEAKKNGFTMAIAIVDGKIIGAIGVSGGNSVQDAQIATAGLESLTKK